MRSEDDSGVSLKEYRDCLNLVTCENPTQKCCFSECKQCPGLTVLRNTLETMFEEDSVESVRYKQWLNVDRCSLETIEKSADDFVDSFIEMVPSVLKHDFVSKKQAEFF